MTDVGMPISGCAACAVVPDASDRAAKQNAQELMISVPSVHCAACMSTIETALMRDPRVIEARVNLSLRRVFIKAQPSSSVEDFVPIVQGAGYDAYPLDQEMVGQREDETARGYLLRMGVAGFAMMNVMLMSISVWTGATESTRDLLHWVSAMFAVPAIVYAAQPFFRSAGRSLKTGQLNMDVPISLAIILAVLMSIYEVSQSRENAYFDAALSLTFFLLIGRYLDYRTRSVARSAAQELAALEVQKATRIGENGDEIVSIADLQKGDLLRILPGARIPVDGEIISGESDIDTAFISGESVPVVMGEGQSLRAGMLNLTGMIVLRADAVGEDTSLQQISRLVSIAENSRNAYTSLADRAAKIYAPVVHLLALFGFVLWIALGAGWEFAMGVAIALLVITCPCALGLAVPSVNTAASGKLFHKGVLLKSETALERLAEVDVVVFDKTGTLTMGTPELVSIEGGNLDMALALAERSGHPLSQALTEALRAQGVNAREIGDAHEIAGKGVEARVGDRPVRLGRPEWIGAHSSSEQSEVWLQMGDELTRFSFQDQLRSGVEEAIRDFENAGIRTILLSGDRQSVVKSVAERLGIAEYHAEVTPEEKSFFIKKLKEDGHRPLMVGDGLNDTVALSEAHVSMAPGRAVDVARSAADVVFLMPEFDAVFASFTTAKSARSRILENFGMAATYNCISIPIALLGFATPFMAALAMSTSSICVVLNANRVRWQK